MRVGFYLFCDGCMRLLPPGENATLWGPRRLWLCDACIAAKASRDATQAAAAVWNRRADDEH